MKLKGIDNDAVSILIGGIIPDYGPVPFHIHEAVGIIRSTDSLAVKGAILDQRPDRSFLNVNMLGCNVRAENDAPDRIVMRFWSYDAPSAEPT